MPATPDSPFDTEQWFQLVDAAVAKILQCEDFAQFSSWFAGEISACWSAAAPPEPELSLFLACALGRQIWNATPLPANQFRPRTVATPGRNDRCLQGLPTKHKHCCGAVPLMPALSQEDIWTLVTAHLPQPELERAVATRRMPDAALGTAARRLIEQGAATRAVGLLEPLFSGCVERLDHRHQEALYSLCDAYDELDQADRKMRLLEHVARDGRGELKAAAWQRIATIAMDAGDLERTWQAFREAQRAAPDDPTHAHLEVTLLVSAGRHEEAKVRAAFWLRQLQRQGYDDPRLLSFLEQAQRAPGAALADLHLDASSDDAQQLRPLVRACLDQAVAPYRARPVGEEGTGTLEPELHDLEESLRQMGIAPDRVKAEARKIAAELKRQLQRPSRRGNTSPEGQGTLPLETAPQEHADHVLVTPEALRAVEQGWREVFRCGKPSLVSLYYVDGTDPWTEANAWVAYLERHPQAFDSLDILDDVACAIESLPGGEAPWMDVELLEPLLARAERTLDAALGGASARLPWGCSGNRPVLRLLARLAFLRQRSGHKEAARHTMRRMLALNPGDNHGFRNELVDALLQNGEDRAALDLVSLYADDIGAHLTYGAALAHFRLGALDKARVALKVVLKYHDKIPRYLAEAELTRPRFGEYGIAFGGDDEAWLYRESMRATWTATPGALEWLASEASAGNIASAARNSNPSRRG